MEKEIRKALRKVKDPELNVNIVDLGLIYKVEEKKGKVKILMTLTSPMCPLAYTFDELVKRALKKVGGIKSVKIKLTFDPPWDPTKISQRAKLKLEIPL